MAQKAPKSVGFIMFGFISLTLPPFGLFMGKIFAIESIVASLKTQPWMILPLLAIILGSALLVLLYFKIASALLSKPTDTMPSNHEKMPLGFFLPLATLTLASIITALAFIVLQDKNALFLFALPLLLLILLPLVIKKMNHFDRVKVYHCGEKESFDSALFYFEPSNKVKTLIYTIFTLLFILIAVVGGVS